MAIKDWEDEWRIPVLTREIPAEIEEEEARQEHTHVEEVGQEQTQPQEVTVPKKPRTGQNKPQQKKGGTSKTGVQTGKKNNTQAPQVQQKQAEAAHRGLHQVLLHKSQARLSGQPPRRGVHKEDEGT
jgi:hypothetical protein